MSGFATWDKIAGALGSTTTTFGGEWGNLISDYFNGVDIGLSDPTKLPKIGTLTRFKPGKLGLYDPDESHEVVFYAEDIDTGAQREIRIRRMNAPNTTDYMVMENMTQELTAKIINADQNTITNIENADIKAGAAIAYSKLALTNSIVTADLTNSLITLDKMADNSVGTSELIDGNVTLAKLASASVNSDKIVNDSIVDTDIGAHTSTKITITTKAQLNSNVVYNDQANTYGAGFMQTFRGGQIRILDSVNASHAITLLTADQTADVNVSFPLLSASDTFALLGISNVFTAQQKVSLNGTVPLVLYKPINTQFTQWGINFNANDSLGAEQTYGYIFASLEDNTSTSKDSYIGFNYLINNSLARRFFIGGSGIGIGTSGTQLLLTNTGLSADRTFTAPDLSGELATINATQTVTSKTFDQKNNTFLRLSRVGIYSPGSDNNGFDNATGALKGLVGVGGVLTQLNTAGKYHQWYTAGTAVDDAAGVVKLDSYTTWRITSPVVRFAFLFVPNTSSNRRIFKGWGAQRLLSTNTDTIPLASSEHGFLFGHGAGDTVFSIFHNDGTGTCVKTPTSVSLPGVITNYILEIQANDSVPNFVWTLYSVVSQGARGSMVTNGTGTITTRIPSQTAGLYLQDLAIGTTTAVQHNNIHYIEVFTS